VSYSIAAIAVGDLRSRLTFLRFHIHCEISAETEETTNHLRCDTRDKLLFVIHMRLGKEELSIQHLCIMQHRTTKWLDSDRCH